jgi:hypothetical protein
MPDTPTLPTATPCEYPQNVYGTSVKPARNTASAVAWPIFPVQLFTMMGGPAPTATERLLHRLGEIFTIRVVFDVSMPHADGMVSSD